MLLSFFLAAMSCVDVESELQGEIDGLKERIEILQGRADALNEQLATLGHITSGNVITSVSQDSEGKYVVTYLDSKGESATVVIATMEQMVNVPLLGVEQDGQNHLYYWTVTVDGETSYLMNDGEKVPVSGYTPEISVDADGYWTIGGQRVNDASGNPIQANDGESCVFRNVEVNADGDLEITQGDGSVITLPVQQALNLTLSAPVNTTVAFTSTSLDIEYDVTGTNAGDAMVAVAEAEGVEASIDRAVKTISVTFPEGFTQGYIIAVANDLGEHTVIRPVFFEKATSDRIEIYTAEDLVEFADNVNAGGGAENMDAILMNDIDMKDVSSWTPIGNGKFNGTTSTSTYEGPAFKGTFDGQGYSIRNFRLTADLEGDRCVFGLFGILDGATVKNLTVGAADNDSGELTFSATGITEAGVFAGAVMSSVVENCVNYVPMYVKGNSTNAKRTTMGAFAGFVYGGDTPSVLRNLTNYGSIKAEPGNNTGNGGTSVMAGGIAGFANAVSSINSVYGCVNYADMVSSCPRTSGIVATMQGNTTLELCRNYGNQENSSAARAGMITCIMAGNCTLKDCENYGDAVMSGGSKAGAGGMVCLTNSTTAVISGGGSYGDVVCDNTGYRGIIAGQFGSVGKVENVKVGGSVGTYNGGDFQMEVLTSDNYMDYLGAKADANAGKISNIIFYAEDRPAGIYTASDLLEFAEAVNSGASIEKWQAEDGGVNMYANIDLASVTDWTPIGNAVCPAGAEDAGITGNAWTGNFNGNGKTISNLKLVSDGTSAGQDYGFFGVLAPGSTVQNLVFDASCSLEVTASASVASGVVAGYVWDATVRDVTSYASMSFKGHAGNTFMGMALIGQIYSSGQGVTVDSCHNYGEITAENTDGNDQSDAAAYHIAGIVSFAHAVSGASVVNTISDCSNYGNITSATARSAGIVGSCNSSTRLVNCINHGNQTNSFFKDGGGRLGNITCYTGSGVSLTGCVNYGNLTSITGARVGGISCLTNTATFENCANYGVILSDDTNRGLFWGYNSAAATWKNCTAGGKLGSYNGGNPVYDSYTEAEQEKYLGVVGSGLQTNFENITYQVGTTDPGAGTGDAEFSILFIGNSFTKDAVEHLPGILKAAGLDKIQLTHMYYGGHLISQYYSEWEVSAGYHRYDCGPGAGVWTESTGYSLKDVAESRSWDIVVLQEHTGNSAAWMWNADAQNNIQGLVNKVRASQTGAMPEFYYILSQAYHDMGKIGSTSKPYITWTDQAGMWDVIAGFGKAVMENVSFDGIISTGAMLQNLRTSSLNVDNGMDLTRDGYHMDYGISRYGAACTVFETLITPLYGITMDDNTFRYSVSGTSSTAYSTPVTDENAPVALQAARYAIESPYEVTDMSGM